jgi:glucokinase
MAVSSVLLADIGGTNIRFALTGSSGRPEHIRVTGNVGVPDLETALQAYLEETGARPQAAILAIAAPIEGEEVVLTNRSWFFRQSELARRFGFNRLRVVNDFEAIAWALPRLRPDDVRPLGPPLAPGGGVKVALGPGTGLGVSALLPLDDHWHVLAGEGGHISFGPQAPEETEVFSRMRAAHGYVSAETVLSGPGLVRLARALDPQSPPRPSEMIVAAALAGEPAALAVARLFVRLLARFAGDLALIFKAQGGVFIAGGVAAGLGPLLDDPQWRATFEAHPPHENLLAKIPTLLLTCTEPGLLGCAALAAEESFV